MVKQKKITIWGVLLLAFAAIVYFYRTLPSEYKGGNKQKTVGLNRDPAKIVYSKHAQCRMDCREISESEVKELLTKGRWNKQKSSLTTSDPCQKRYALEGRSADGQNIRMIAASCGSTTTIITVIDLEREWTCSCH